MDFFLSIIFNLLSTFRLSLCRHTFLSKHFAGMQLLRWNFGLLSEKASFKFLNKPLLSEQLVLTWIDSAISFTYDVHSANRKHLRWWIKKNSTSQRFWGSSNTFITYEKEPFLIHLIFNYAMATCTNTKLTCLVGQNRYLLHSLWSIFFVVKFRKNHYDFLGAHFLSLASVFS